MHQPLLLLIEWSASLRCSFSSLLVSLGFRASSVAGISEVEAFGRTSQPDLVVLGPGSVTPDTLGGVAFELRNRLRQVPLLLIARDSSEELAIAALRAGINEYVKFPTTGEELAQAVMRCLPSGSREHAERKPGAVHFSTVAASSVAAEEKIQEKIIGESALIREVKDRLAKVASSNSNVLVTGETGTGKELVAELLHENGPRHTKPFVAINCAAIPDSLLESELFGYEKGAFTGAQHNKPGRLKAADGGTVFLDEIGEMSSYAQAKILRMIEGKEVQRLGRDGGVGVDIRIVAATNMDLESMVKEDKFRKDLFYRLNVARVHLPPLRERKEDLQLLVQHYIRYFNQRFGRAVLGLCDEAMDCLLAYDWPGNVRELKNLIEAIFVELPVGETSVSHVPIQVRERCAAVRSAVSDERSRLLWALSSTNWNKSKAAGKLNWSRMTLYRKMARYNIVHL